MSIPLFLYLAALCDKVLIVSGILAVIAALCAAPIFIEKSPKVYRVACVSTFILSSIVFTLTPTSDTAYAMAAGYGVERVAENPDVKRLAGKSLQLLENTIDSQLNKGAKAP